MPASPNEEQCCPAMISSGKNRGKKCGRKVAAGDAFCRYHRSAASTTSLTPNIVAKHLPATINVAQQDVVEKGENSGGEFDPLRFLSDLQQIAEKMAPISRWVEMMRERDKPLASMSTANKSRRDLDKT